jgi:hypothetical protein
MWKIERYCCKCGSHRRSTLTGSFYPCAFCGGNEWSEQPVVPPSPVLTQEEGEGWCCPTCKRTPKTPALTREQARVLLVVCNEGVVHAGDGDNYFAAVIMLRRIAEETP